LQHFESVFGIPVPAFDKGGTDGTFTWLLRLLLRRRFGALKPQKKWWRVYDFQQSASPVCFDQKSPTTNLQAATP
jgi:hypothetical protein